MFLINDENIYPHYPLVYFLIFWFIEFAFYYRHEKSSFQQQYLVK